MGNPLQFVQDLALTESLELAVIVRLQSLTRIIKIHWSNVTPRGTCLASRLASTVFLTNLHTLSSWLTQSCPSFRSFINTACIKPNGFRSKLYRDILYLTGAAVGNGNSILWSERIRFMYRIYILPNALHDLSIEREALNLQLLDIPRVSKSWAVRALHLWLLAPPDKPWGSSQFFETTGEIFHLHSFLKHVGRGGCCWSGLFIECPS